MQSHEWIRSEGNGEYTIGITEHAQELLGDMVFVDLPDVGSEVDLGDDCAVAESVKLHQIFMPHYLAKLLQ